MPTNVTKPDWACDLCGTAHGDNFDLAARCESAPVPDELPAGTPLLRINGDRFVLDPLHSTGKVTTIATSWNDTAGHVRHYWSGRDSRITWDSQKLYPHEAGHVQVRVDESSGWHIAHAGTTTFDLAALARELGLGQPGSNLSDGHPRATFDHNTSSNFMVGPITELVRAVFDALDVRLGKGGLSPYWKSRLRERLALHTARGDVGFARALLDHVDRGTIDAALWEGQRAWFSGEAVTCVEPILTAHSTRTASTLTKPLRALVEATGVEWESRSSANDYVRYLVRKTLMTSEPVTTRAWPNARIVAVGGGKGGVGKSTVAAAVANRLADEGHTVTLIDLDLDGPNQHILFELPDRVRVTGDLTQLMPHQVRDGLAVFSHGQIDSSALVTEWNAAATAQWVEFLSSNLRVDTEFVVLDLPAGRGSVAGHVLDRRKVLSADVALFVTSGEAVAVSDARAAIMSSDRSIPRVVVENLSEVTGACPDGVQVTVRVAGRDGDVADLAAGTNATFAGSLPWNADPAHLARSQQLGNLASCLVSEARR